MLCLVAPVADRAWALPTWFAYLAEQTVTPDALAFVHSGQVGDPTWRALETGAQTAGLSAPIILHDPARPHARHDNERFRTLARLRNLALDAAASVRADLVLSLDTDVMLSDPQTIERLSDLVADGRCDIAAPVAFLHPGAPPGWHPGQTPCWAYNFGWLADSPAPVRQWLRRPSVDKIDWGAVVDADVPMAAWVAGPRAAACRYEWHESGEDVAFARSLRARGCRFQVDTSLYAWHCWDAGHLEQPPTAAA
ncbi:MAG: hypothetical protein ACRDSS_03120 [Actinocrinis sp.]